MPYRYLHTGQRLCHDALGKTVECAGSGQDAAFAPGARLPDEERFELLGDEVLDRLTGLTWTASARAFDFPLDHAETLRMVHEMNGPSTDADASDAWRLPTRRELRSLVDYSRPAGGTALPPGHPFRDPFPGWYWTATPWAGDTAYAWYVQLTGGRMFYGHVDSYAMAWPVRGRSDVLPDTGPEPSGLDVPWPDERFLVQGETAVDTLTGLAWTLDADIFGLVDWETALDRAGEMRAARTGGLEGWRLPTINELETLVDATQLRPALPQGHPFRNVRDTYHSSTSSGFEPDWCMALYFDKGAVGVGHKPSARFHVWCVAPVAPVAGEKTGTGDKGNG